MSTESENIEWQRPDVAAFIDYRATLLDAITEPEILPLANALYSEGVISRYALEEAEMTTRTPTERKTRLLDAIEDKIKTASTCMTYCIVLGVLSSDSLCLSEHARKLESSYLRIQSLYMSLILQRYEQTLQLNNLYSPWLFTGCHFDNEHLQMSSSRLCNSIYGAEANSAQEDDKEDPESNDKQESQGFLSGLAMGNRKLFGAARDLTATSVKEALKSLNLDIHVCRKYKKRFDKHTNREQVHWWFEIWGDESALTALESNWDKISAQTKWRLCNSICGGEANSAQEDDEQDTESNDKQESQGFFSGLRKGIRKMFGAARDLTAAFVKGVIKSLNLDIHISRKYKKRFDKHTNREQVRWWFEIWGDESALTALESNWDKISAQTKWRLETCPVVSQRC